jgi:hypothetical protein
MKFFDPADDYQLECYDGYTGGHPFNCRNGNVYMLAEIVWNQDTAATVAVVCVFAVPITAIVAVFWSKVETRKSDNDLKRSMVERGMHADEIERILSAKTCKR